MGNCLKPKVKRNYEPTADEIIKYGISLGLTLPDDEDLLYIAQKGLTDFLPHPWKRCKTPKGDIYYFNTETDQSESQHPCDSYYKQLVREAKRLNWLRNVKPTSLLNYQISSTHDFNSKLKETKNALNIDTLRNKTAKILSRPNNSELEMDFRATCKKYRTNSNRRDPLLKQAYQDYLNAYQIKTSLYSFDEFFNGFNSIVYNTETEVMKRDKHWITPNKLSLGTCVTQLPNGKLFCFSTYWISGITVLLNVNGEIEMLPSGTPCSYSSCIYFNNSVYCFGGKNTNLLKLSNRFDLDLKKWIQLTPMPQADYECSSIIFNGNILISRCIRTRLLLYSIDINSFSTIPYQFSERKSKILINTERLYLIEGDDGFIYESEIGSYTNWKQIGKSTMEFNNYYFYYSYNKGGIYIVTGALLSACHYKFDLNTKLLSSCLKKYL